jgi:hypothetical protein
VKHRGKTGSRAARASDSAGHTELNHAIASAMKRGLMVKETLAKDPDMWSSAKAAEFLGVSAEGLRQKRRRHEILGLNVEKRSIRYPAWQFLEHGAVLPGLQGIIAILRDDWRVYIFLEGSHAELGGQRARDALAQGKEEQVLAAAENMAHGAFA